MTVRDCFLWEANIILSQYEATQKPSGEVWKNIILKPPACHLCTSQEFAVMF